MRRAGRVVQNYELARYLDATTEAVHTQWSPLLLFLVLFVAGLALIGWMVHTTVAAQRHPARG